MKIDFDLFDNVLEKQMADLVYGGNTSRWIYDYYTLRDKTLDKSLLREIVEDWREVEAEDESEARQMAEGLKEDPDVFNKSVQITDVGPIRVVWKERRK